MTDDDDDNNNETADYMNTDNDGETADYMKQCLWAGHSFATAFFRALWLK